MKKKGLIWTNHILERMNERKLSFDDVYWVFKKPDEFHYDEKKGTYKYYRYLDNSRLAVVATKNDNKEWVLMTCWIKDLDNSMGRKRVFKKRVDKGGFWQGLLADMWRMLIGK